MNKRQPDCALAINGLGGCDLEEHNYKSAENAFRTAIELVSYEPQYHINLAWALLRQVKEPGETPKAEESLRKGLLNESVASCRKALEIEPNAKATFASVSLRSSAMP